MLSIHCQGQTRVRSPRGSVHTNGIRGVDFLNFTYYPTLCNRELGTDGIGKVVRMRKGEFKNADIYYGVADRRVLYGRLTGDDRDVAIVHIGCGQVIANFRLSEIFTYAMQNGKAVLRATVNDKDMEHDYSRYYPDETLWGITDTGIRVTDGKLIIERFTEGSHACPTAIVTFEYRLGEKRLLLNKQPVKKSSNLSC